MEKIWKDIEGYVGFYQISNLGNVKSLERIARLYLQPNTRAIDYN